MGNCCIETYEINQGDLLAPVIGRLLSAETGELIKTDDIVSLSFKMYGVVNGARAEIISETAAGWYDKDLRLAVYYWSAGQTDTPGIFTGYFIANYNNGKQQSFAFRIYIKEL